MPRDLDKHYKDLHKGKTSGERWEKFSFQAQSRRSSSSEQTHTLLFIQIQLATKIYISISAITSWGGPNNNFSENRRYFEFCDTQTF